MLTGHRRLLNWVRFVDLKDLCDQFEVAFAGETKIAVARDDLVKALEKAVLLSGCCSFGYLWSHGLSIYFPWALVSADYGNMKFAKRTDWIDFLQDHVLKTPHPPRYGSITVPPPSLPEKTAEFTSPVRC